MPENEDPLIAGADAGVETAKTEDLTYDEAFAACEAGNRIKRAGTAGWIEKGVASQFLRRDPATPSPVLYVGGEEDLAATDWQIVQPE